MHTVNVSSIPLRISWILAALAPIACKSRFAPPAEHQNANGPTIATLEFPDLKDDSRGGRRVPIKVHYPVEKGRYPLVLVSHGGGGDWDTHAEQARDLAAHGYVVLCVQHTGSDKACLQEGIRKLGLRNARRATHLLTTDSQEVLARPRDLSFAIDRAMEWDRAPGKLQGMIDTESIAAMGHSFGAYTVLAACGAQPILDHLVPRVEPGSGLAGDLRDRRIKAGIVLSPQPPGSVFFGKESYASIGRPLLLVTGSKDVLNGADGADLPPERRKEVFGLLPAGGKLFFWLEGADHLAFYDSDNARELKSDAREDAQRIVKALTLAFCDLHLKGKKEAAESLTEKAANALCGKVVTRASLQEK